MGRSGKDFEKLLILHAQEVRSETDARARAARPFLGLKPTATIGIEEFVSHQKWLPLRDSQAAGPEKFCACYFVERYVRAL
jgi:hypothetical protein